MATAFVYDPFNLKHTLDGHPEHAGRLTTTVSLLRQDGIWEQLLHLQSRSASAAEVQRVHGAEYVDRVRTLCDWGGGHLDPDTYLNPHSLDAALLAAGGLLQVTEEVVRGQAQNGFALIRPPGHHAVPNRGMGFCLLNNVAIAARHAVTELALQRVLIIDLDVHHGNGTQDAFYADGNVLFFSTHQYPYYPFTGGLRETGSGSGRGATVNVPLPEGVGDRGYRTIWHQILAPVARRFRPQLILLSIGYDAHWLDPLSGMNLSISGYADLLTELVALADELCQGRLVCCLEGGYHLKVLAHSVLTSLRILAGTAEDPSDPFGAYPGPERGVTEVVAQVRALHKLP